MKKLITFLFILLICSNAFAGYDDDSPQMAPDGSWVGGDPQMAPDGSWVGVDDD